MNTESEVSGPSLIGHMITLGAGHSIALYERKGEAYVAEFRDGRVEFTHAAAWYRLYAGCLRYCRGAPYSASPLTREMLEGIERLHRESEVREERMLAVLRSIATAVQRYLVNVMSRRTGSASKITETLG